MSPCIQEVHDACVCEQETRLEMIFRVTDEVLSREHYGSNKVTKEEEVNA